MYMDENTVDDIDALLRVPEETQYLPFPDPPPLNALSVPEQWAKAMLSTDAVVTPTEVVSIIGGREGVVRAWLRDTVTPLRHPSGRVIYRWGDVLAAMSRAA